MTLGDSGRITGRGWGHRLGPGCRVGSWEIEEEETARVEEKRHEMTFSVSLMNHVQDLPGKKFLEVNKNFVNSPDHT